MANRIQVGLGAEPEEVRRAILAVSGWLVRHGTVAERAGEIEIALTEAVNNVVEHACADAPGARLRITCRLSGDALEVRLRDTGAEMPGGRLPDGRPADLSVPTAALPEGGFGWLLIREIADTVRYRRRAASNLLDLRFGMPPV